MMIHYITIIVIHDVKFDAGKWKLYDYQTAISIDDLLS